MIVKRQIGEKGQIVIPKDIRKSFKLHKGVTVTVETDKDTIIIRREQDPEEFLKEFFSIARNKNKRNLTLKDLKKMEEESYDLP